MHPRSPRRRATLLAMMLSLAGPAAIAQQPANAASDKYAVGERLPAAGTKAGKPAFREVTWETLVPKGWDPGKIFENLDMATLQDGDPRAMEALEKMRAAWNDAPVDASLNNTKVRIPGFMIPIDTVQGKVTEFLLVPYFGACIHTPPPPANQIIHVFPSKPLKDVRMMDAIWVSGTIQTSRTDTEFGKSGYRMQASVIAPYKKD